MRTIRPIAALGALIIFSSLILACASGGASASLSPVGNGVADGATSGEGSAGAPSAAPAAPDEQGGDFGGGDGVGAPIDDARIVRTGTIDLEVGDVGTALTKARDGIRAMGGYIGASSTQNDGDTPIASVTYRVPSDRWEDALDLLRGISGPGTKVVAERTDAIEVTGQVIDLQARIKNLRAAEASLQEIATKAVKISDVLEVQAQLTNVRGQIEQFERSIDDIARLGIDIRFRHMANSPATIRGQIGSSNLVRSGIATYGLSPSSGVPVDDRFEPIMTLRSVVERRFIVQPGESVSYNQTFTATAPTEAADIPIGYADGLPRNVSNAGWLSIAGERCPILGRVCMDQLVVAVPEGVSEGDSVVVIGSGRDGEMTFDDAGRLAGTNNYEVATRLMPRVPRIYRRAGEPVAWEHLLLGERGRLSEQ